MGTKIVSLHGHLHHDNCSVIEIWGQDAEMQDSTWAPCCGGRVGRLDSKYQQCCSEMKTEKPFVEVKLEVLVVLFRLVSFVFWYTLLVWVGLVFLILTVDTKYTVVLLGSVTLNDTTIVTSVTVSGDEKINAKWFGTTYIIVCALASLTLHALRVAVMEGSTYAQKTPVDIFVFLLAAAMMFVIFLPLNGPYVSSLVYQQPINTVCGQYMLYVTGGMMVLNVSFISFFVAYGLPAPKSTETLKEPLLKPNDKFN